MKKKNRTKKHDVHVESYIRYCHEKWQAARAAADSEPRLGALDAGGPLMKAWMSANLPGLYANLDGTNPFRAYMIGLLDGYDEVIALLDADRSNPRLPRAKKPNP